MLSKLTSLFKLTEQNVKRNTIIQIIIVTLAFVLFARIWPMGIVKEHTYSNQKAMTAVEYTQAASFMGADKKLQGVRFTQEHLYQITLYMSCMEYEKDDYVLFRLYNNQFSCIYEEEVGCKLIMKDGALIATPDMDVVPGQDYYYEILIPSYTVNRTVDEKLILPIAEKVMLEQEENQILYIDGIYNDKEALIADFDYTQALPAWKIVLAGLFTVLLAVGVYVALTLMLDKIWNWVLDYIAYIRFGAAILIGAGSTAVFILVVCKNVFGGAILDRIVYAIGIISAMMWLLCVVLMPKAIKIEKKLPVYRRMSLMWRNYLQAMSFGLAIHSLCQYVNADREFIHVTNIRWMLIFLGIAFLMIQTEKELCNIFSYIWLGLSMISSFIYYYMYEGESEELYVLKLTLAVVVIWGLVVLNAVLQLKKDCWKQISKPFLLVWLLFAFLMIYWRFDKNWVFTATLPFVVLLLYNLSATGRSRLLTNFTNGVFISYAIYMLYSMHHRPYNMWYFYRYSGMFHTVAYTGMFLTIVAGVAFAKLYSRWRQPVRFIRRGWKELFIFGMSVSGILMSMSRTAMLSILITIVLIFALAAFVFKKSLVVMGKELLILGLAVVLCLPLNFSMTRMLPALADDPVYISTIETAYREHNVHKGDDINDTEKYISVERYLSVLLGRFQISVGQEEEESVYVAENEENPVENSAVAVDTDKTDSSVTVDYVVEIDEDVSNGRMDIYRGYFENLTIEGHENLSLPLENGKTYVHAHNSYLQVAYDFGIPAGIVFLILCALTLWRAVRLFYKYGTRYTIYLVPFALVIVFGITSVTEWAFHPGIPTGFVFILVQMLLMQEPVVSNKQKG